MRIERLAMAAVATVGLTACMAAPAEAQVIVLGRGRALGLGVPGAAVRLGPARLPAGVYLGGRPLVVFGPPPIGPAANNPQMEPSHSQRDVRPRMAARRDRRQNDGGARAGVDAQSLPTSGQLRAMDDNELVRALGELSAQFHVDVERFTTAETWQRYLGLPEDAVVRSTARNETTLDLPSLAETLARFDSVVANPEYVQISGLASFAATHAALAEVVRRFGRDASVVGAAARSEMSVEMQRLHEAPGAAEDFEGEVAGAGEAKPVEEELPPPTPSPSLVAPQNGERSVLSR